MVFLLAKYLSIINFRINMINFRISEKVKSLFTLQHATLSEISECAVKMIAQVTEVDYSKSDSLEMKGIYLYLIVFILLLYLLKL